MSNFHSRGKPSSIHAVKARCLSETAQPWNIFHNRTFRVNWNLICSRCIGLKTTRTHLSLKRRQTKPELFPWLLIIRSMWLFFLVIWANWPIKGFFKHCSHLSLSHLYNPTLTWQIRSKTFWQTFWTKWTSPSSEPQDSVHDSAQNKVLFTGRLRKMRRIVFWKISWC